MATFLTRALGLAPQAPPPGFFAEIKPIDAEVEARMDSSWRPGCPVPLFDLRYVLVDYWGLDGREHRGELVVHTDWADEIVAVFGDLFDARFPFEEIVLVDEYGGDDRRSMAANNTSAFNCRFVSGTSRWSEHAYGRAIDINPVQNPYVRGSTVQPPAGSAFLDRTLVAPGMVHSGDVVVAAFEEIGWGWGGDWINSKDYQHFSATGG
ncbi:MAG: M15 family metallopeptidase [bacterium]|nr:M15 family metallopeptidase [bacterium]